MGRQITIPDDLYEQLEMTAHQRGLETIEALLRQWQQDLQHRDEAVERVQALSRELAQRYPQGFDVDRLLEENGSTTLNGGGKIREQTRPQELLQ
jgi:hypothetical protein